jgi:trehalose 6-phosphate synthase/phosphatase
MSLVIVSNRLPVSVRKVDGKLEFFPSTGGLATGLASYTSLPGTKWIGWPGVASDSLTDAERERITKRLRRERCYPVFLTQAQIDEFYSGYSNSVLWPLFHDLELSEQSKNCWPAYKRVNRLFADMVLELTPAGSTIWVHDYQLLLVPEMLRQAERGDRIGHFLHIPFPELSQLRRLREAKYLLRGVLGADLAGFHTRSYAANFVAACDALLGTGAATNYVEHTGRIVHVLDFPMGIDYGRFMEALRQPSNRRALVGLRREYRGLKVILTVDRLDPSKGLVERLEAYRSLLRQNPHLHGRVVMVMVVSPSRTDVREYQRLKERLDALLAEIDAEFGRGTGGTNGSAHASADSGGRSTETGIQTDAWQPVDYKYETLPLETVMLYYQLADVAFITPLRDGMNLVAKEYLASKPGGALVLSQTAGAAEELRDAIQVDPGQPWTLVRGLKQALTLPKQELQVRARRMRQHIGKHTVQHWATNFIDTLQRPPQAVQRALPRPLTARRSAALVGAYCKAAKRLILLDYDGTLREFVNDPMAAKPTSELRRVLRRLGENPANEVVLVSGRSKENLAEWFGDLPVALAAEHGAFFRRRGGKNWHRNSQIAPGWQQPITDLFMDHTATTPGAFVEQKNAAVVWHYRAARPYDAQKSLVAIRRQLKPLLAQYGLLMKAGNKVLEVHAADISKGRVAQEWLIHDHDFVLTIGDDTTDEDMFTALSPAAYSIKVGLGTTAARFRLLELLNKL